jgi:hypothetical protein
MAEEVELSRTSPETREQVERAENIQTLVAIAILSGYLTILTGGNAPFQSFSFAIKILAFVALLFLVGKLITLSVRPFYEHAWLRTADRKALPGIFVVMFVVTFAVILPSVIPLPGIDSDGFIQLISQILPDPLEAADIYIILCTTVSIVFAFQYASWTAETMSDLETAAPNVRISFTSGSRGQTFPLKLKNPDDKEIPPEDVRIEVEATSGVDVDIPQAKSLGEGIWRPRLAVPADDRMNVPIQINRSEDAEGISDESVEVVIKYLGRTQQKHVVELEG